MTDNAVLPTLLTFAPMIDSEVCRIALEHYGIPYAEKAHLFGWVSILALFRGGTPQVPLLVGPGLNLAGPRAMVDHFETKCAPSRKLIPLDVAGASQANADWERFHGPLADATAVLGYYYLLPHREIMLEPFLRGIPRAEAAALQVGYPLLAGLFRLLLQLNATHAGKALTQTRAILDEADRRLADGRQYIAGDRLTLSDVALATAMAPLLLPDGYTSPMPLMTQMPSELQAIITEMRQRETARLVERVFGSRSRH